MPGELIKGCYDSVRGGFVNPSDAYISGLKATYDGVVSGELIKGCYDSVRGGVVNKYETFKSGVVQKYDGIVNGVTSE